MMNLTEELKKILFEKGADLAGVGSLKGELPVSDRSFCRCSFAGECDPGPAGWTYGGILSSIWHIE